MAPPPVTPSPHRFLTSEPAKTTPKPTSSLRFQQSSTQAPSSQQFAPTPKFNLGFTQRSRSDSVTPATQYSSPLSRRPQLPIESPKQNREDIEETNLDREVAEEPNKSATASTLPSQPASKRHRPNPPKSEPIIISSSPPLPTTEKDEPEPEPLPRVYGSPAPRPHQRFVLPSPARNETPSIPSRPPLILPPRSPSPQLEAPAFFSPHRRGQKYVPGGLAAVVRDWIVETSQVAHNQARARRGGGEAWDFEVRVGELRGEDAGVGVVLVRERQEGKKWMLAGRARGDTEVEVGCVVGIREPSWKIGVEGESWHVAVDWKVLGG